MLDTILLGGYICAYIAAAAAGLVNCDLYKDWKAEQEQGQERVVCAANDETDITTSADAELPDIVITLDGGN